MEETKTHVEQQVEGGEKQETKPEGAEQQPKENMIPKSRFDEVNSKYKELLEKVKAFEEAESQRQKESEEKELQLKKEQGKFEELYNATQKELETYKQYEARAKQLEGLIQGMVEAKMKAIPEDMADLVPPNLTVEQTLDWLNKAEAKGLFVKKEPKEVGKPSNKSNESPKIDRANMSAFDKILSGLGR
jgi:hypothetical protein